MIIGYRQTVRRLAALMTQCRSCGMSAWQQAYRRITWFTVFFLPVLPLWVSWGVVCGTCGKENKLGKRATDALVAQAR